ncbi:MAG: HAMP domain-containing histidine kinase [Clostridia bacterium]|nr:HAMP domain-containing histidine kinase [Clostridia bacterium]
MSKKTRRQLRAERKAQKEKVRGIRGRIKYLLSNFRLSLTFRIALHYSWQMLRTTLLALIILTVFFAGTVLADLESDMRRIRIADAAQDGTFSQLVIQDEAIEATLWPWPYSDETSPLLQYRVNGLDFHSGSLWLTADACHHTGQTIRIEANLYWPFISWCWLMLGAVLCDLLRMVFFLRNRERLNKSVLSPIRDITEMATTLSANNLSNRINIAGTKNELRDLAVVINSMLDRIERSYNSQKQFVSDASHELRTPIAVIQGYINMLQRWGKSDPEILDEGISAIAQETESMKDLVESLLFLARHDKKTLMMEMAQFDVLDVVSELHREAAMVTPEDTFVLSPAVNCLIEGDRGMIKQVMRILCDNAVKYTPRGGTITIGVEHEPGWCTLSVTDNGPGISSEELPKIFDRFYRSDSARKSEGGGHGLGLSIARIIVMAHGGKLRVRSKVGSGSTFYVVLPEKQDRLHTAKLSTAEAASAGKADH